MTPTEIFIKIQDILTESLALEKEEVSSKSLLINDLGMDSIDFLDIIFSLERTFEVDLKNSELTSLTRRYMGKEDEIAEKYIAKKDIDQLMDWLPGLKDAEEPYQIEPQNLFAYITVEALVILMARKIEEKIPV